VDVGEDVDDATADDGHRQGKLHEVAVRLDLPPARRRRVVGLRCVEFGPAEVQFALGDILVGGDVRLDRWRIQQVRHRATILAPGADLRAVTP
jgi:hypothetical protein